MSKEVEKAEEPEITERLERLIWKSAGRKSVRKLAEETGLDAAWLLRTRNEMLDSVDDLTVRQKRTKLLVELEEIADDARERAERTIDEYYSGMMNSAVAAMKTILVELNRTAKGEQEAVNALNALRVRELTSLMFEVVDATVPLVAERYGIDQDDLFQMFNDSLERAAARRDFE